MTVRQRLDLTTRRNLLLGAGGLLGAAGVGLPGLGQTAWAGEAAPRRFFRISSGSSGGMYYPLAGLIAAAVSNPTDGNDCTIEDVCGVPGLVAVAQTSAGSIENLQRLLSRQAESGFCQADIAMRAFEGEIDGVPEALGQRLRSVAYLYPECLHVVVRRNAGMRLLADLVGKRVSLGSRGAATYRDSDIFLEAFGLRKSSLHLVDLSSVQAARGIRDETLDAFLLVSGVPANTITTLAADQMIDLLPIDSVVANRLGELLPPFRLSLIQSGIYDHVTITPSLSVGALWLVTEDLDADLVYEITRALWTPATATYLAENDRPLGPQINIENALMDVETPPLHPGAALYYKEIGLLPDS